MSILAELVGRFNELFGRGRPPNCDELGGEDSLGHLLNITAALSGR